MSDILHCSKQVGCVVIVCSLFLLCEQPGTENARLQTLCVFVVFSFAFLFCVGTLCLPWAPLTPARFLPKAWQKLLIFPRFTLSHIPRFHSNFPSKQKIFSFFQKKKKSDRSAALEFCFHINVFNAYKKIVENILFILFLRFSKKSRELPCFFCEE